MKYNRDEYTAFLNAEYNAQIKEYERLINTKAIVLKENGAVFVGLFVGFQDDVALFKVRISNKMPLKNSYWTASCFIGKMGSFKHWEDYSWADLREQYQSGCTDAHCVCISKSEEPDFCLIGIKGITLEFADLLAQQKPVIAFGPKDPPLRYLINLKQIVQGTQSETANAVLDFNLAPTCLWDPRKVKASEDIKPLIHSAFEGHSTIAIQGPPGTGKTSKIAELIAELLEASKSVLVTSMTNEALRTLASKKALKSFLSAGKVSKTSVTLDDKNALPMLVVNKDNTCDASSGNLSLATFYNSSSWAKHNYDTPPFDYVVVDEASQALLPMLAASNILGKKVIWIGDQNQLAPIVLINEDIISNRDWTPIVKGFYTICNNVSIPSFMLTDTYRLTKRGADFTGIFYNNELCSVSEVEKIYTNISNLNLLGGPTLIDIDMIVGDKKPENAFSVIINLSKQILTEHPKAEIAILAKFKETVEALQKSFITQIADEQLPSNIRIETVDKIQGMTVDYTLFLIPNATVAYSLERELFNVATSRARYCTVIVADKKILKNYMNPDVRKFLLKLKE